jgi:hypothetical protein
MIDLIVLTILAIAAWHGWRRGTILMGLSLASIGAGYLGAALLYRPVGRMIGLSFHLPPLVALPVAGLLVLFAISTLIKVMMWKIERKRAQGRREGVEPPMLDGVGGASIGVMRAGALLVVGVWAMLALNSLAHIGPDYSSSFSGRIAAGVMRRATFSVTRRATGDPLMASVLSMMASRPQEGVRTMNAVMRDPRIQRLWTDTLLRSTLAHGDSASLGGSSTVRSLAADSAFMAAAHSLGVMPEGAGNEQLAGRLVEQVGPLVRSVQSVQNDPEIRHMMESPELRQMMQRGDFAALVAVPRFNSLAGKILEKMKQRT